MDTQPTPHPADESPDEYFARRLRERKALAKSLLARGVDGMMVDGRPLTNIEMDALCVDAYEDTIAFFEAERADRMLARWIEAFKQWDGKL